MILSGLYNSDISISSHKVNC